jgi:PadR family transcriptional regulator, regulatory protein PadR
MTRAGLAVLQGTLDLVVLRALTSGPRHGYQVARWVRQTTDGALIVEDGALYTALHRLEKRGLLESAWGATEQNRRAKFYSLTAEGRHRLAAETQTWTQYAEAMFKVLSTASEPAPAAPGQAQRQAR